MLKADTPTIEEIRKAIDMVDRSGGEYYPSSELAVYYIRVLLAELKKRDDELARLRNAQKNFSELVSQYHGE